MLLVYFEISQIISPRLCLFELVNNYMGHSPLGQREMYANFALKTHELLTIHIKYI